ncbi:MAG: hypothetical protein GXY44_04890 [Phycisphaerales bacterium]|nr:hypothetical protein [Phycisphaerales bacterium]
MISCEQCEYFVQGPGGEFAFRCNPFTNIKEPDCLVKWQLIKLDAMVQAYQATISFYKRLAPLQEKMFRHMEREIDEVDESESWKYDDDEEDDDVPSS